ncbi:MAG: hypothetical protein M3O20_09205 [Acidobacteriota bacterium]|nr:hypothetical protein [Acidobacteriota bacterium]
MACPYFKPLRLLDAGGWDPAPRLPLVDAWAGECTAGNAWEPTEAVQRETCNCGYARGRCAHFPDDGEVDAVRFSMAGERLIYIFEKDHAPVEHGDVGAAEIREPLASLMRAFRESYGRAAAGRVVASGGAG